jgi:hypothetical protein
MAFLLLYHTLTSIHRLDTELPTFFNLGLKNELSRIPCTVVPAAELVEIMLN